VTPRSLPTLGRLLVTGWCHRGRIAEGQTMVFNGGVLTPE
jgi:hypothetical protein